MTGYTLTELFDKRSELAGEIVQAEKRAKELRADLAHIEATIRILRPGIDMPKVVPKRIEYRPRYFRRGALTRLCHDYIREHAGEAITVADIVPLATGDRVLNSREQEVLRVSIHTALRKIERRGTIERMASVGRVVRWRLASEA